MAKKAEENKEEKTPDKEKVPDIKDVGPFVSFDLYFSTLKLPAHWKHGMKAFADTNRKLPLSMWAELFKNY